VTISTTKDLRGLERAGRAVAAARDAMLAAVRVGITTSELDAIGKKVLDEHGARSAPRLVYDFPGETCISVNSAAAHGIPDDRPLAMGDLVNVDVSAELDGYFADTGASRAVGRARGRARRLLEATRESLEAGIRAAAVDAPLHAIGRAVERSARASGFAVIESLCGHGVGASIHEPPTVPNVWDGDATLELWEGLVITIEPFLTPGAPAVRVAEDGWTLETIDGSIVAQFEHTLVITRAGPLVLTR
jgi:methionyl aminopeptidase